MDKKIEPKLLKGFRDFSTSQMLKRNFVIAKIREVVESYGFDPLETPTMEYEEILTGSIGEDEKLIYKFTDDGERNVALRYDQTVGACRYIAANYNTLTFPFKRYQVQSAFRAENTQKGRYREFLQFDADIFGVSDVSADCEMILLTCDIYKHLGFTDFKVYFSDRSLVKDVPYKVLVSIDKLDKIGLNGVVKEIEEKGVLGAKEVVDKVLNVKPNEKVEAILSYANTAGFGDNVVFDPSIMRSFSYSTGTIWEVKIDGSKGSLLGGERFDSLVSRFSNYEVPGVGFGLGFDRTLEAMEERDLLPKEITKSQVLISVFDERYINKYIEYANILRKEGINTEIYNIYSDKLAKQFKYADKKGIKYVLIIGDEEIEKDMVSLKNMQTGEQTSMQFYEMIELVKREK